MKSFLQITASILISLLSLELFFTLLGTVPAGSKFVETVVLKSKLTPRKPKGEIRIFTYGESTMHGANYAPYSTPARWLEIYLKDFLPQKNIRIVNFARIGQGVFFSRQTFEQTLAYQPDLVIFYVGHNDYLPGERMDQIDPVVHPMSYYAQKILCQSRFVSFFYRLVLRRNIQKKFAHTEDVMGAETIESIPGTLKMGAATPRNDSTPKPGDFYWKNLNFFRDNLVRILEKSRKKNIPAFFLKPVSNLKDFLPLESHHKDDLTGDQLKLWNQSFDQAVKLHESKNLEASLSYYHKAYEIDPVYALLPFRMGQVYYQMGKFEEAKRYFTEAKDFDAIVCRATREILEVFEKLAQTHGLVLADTEKVLAPEAMGQILGEPIIEDNVHFSIKGHALAGRLMVETIAANGWIVLPQEWDFSRERPYEVIYQNLGITPDILAWSFIRIAGYLGDRYEDRIRTAKRAVSIAPGNLDALRCLAWAYWIAGRQTDAVATYDQIKNFDRTIFDQIMAQTPDLKKHYDLLAK